MEVDDITLRLPQLLGSFIGHIKWLALDENKLCYGGIKGAQDPILYLNPLPVPVQIARNDKYSRRMDESLNPG